MGQDKELGEAGGEGAWKNTQSWGPQLPCSANSLVGFVLCRLYGPGAELQLGQSVSSAAPFLLFGSSIQIYAHV